MKLHALGRLLFSPLLFSLGDVPASGDRCKGVEIGAIESLDIRSAESGFDCIDDESDRAVLRARSFMHPFAPACLTCSAVPPNRKRGKR